jgi:magnesium chelatase family protein
VLFLDELAEFNRHSLEALREPMEAGEISLSRARHSTRYPARFQLVAAMNPCPCGYLGDAERRCHCTPQQVQRYRTRISGPLLDRIDLHVPVHRVPASELLAATKGGEDSAAVRARVCASRELQLSRQGHANAQIPADRLARACQLDSTGTNYLEAAARRMLLSGRALHRTLRVARSIADLEQCAAVSTQHLSEALAYRAEEPPP